MKLEELLAQLKSRRQPSSDSEGWFDAAEELLGAIVSQSKQAKAEQPQKGSSESKLSPIWQALRDFATNRMVDAELYGFLQKLCAAIEELQGAKQPEPEPAEEVTNMRKRFDEHCPRQSRWRQENNVVVLSADAFVFAEKEVALARRQDAETIAGLRDRISELRETIDELRLETEKAERERDELQRQSCELQNSYEHMMAERNLTQGELEAALAKLERRTGLLRTIRDDSCNPGWMNAALDAELATDQGGEESTKREIEGKSG